MWLEDHLIVEEATVVTAITTVETVDMVEVAAAMEEIADTEVPNTITNPRKKITNLMIMEMDLAHMEITTITNQLWISTRMLKMTNQ